MKALGVTSHEVYVRWNLCEVASGRWDWSVYDRYVEVYKKHGLKWVPFLICGSAYSLPDWYYKSPESQGYVCLEHGQESDVQSLWNPALREHVRRFIRAFCEHIGVAKRDIGGVVGSETRSAYRDAMRTTFVARVIEHVMDDHILVSIVRFHPIGRMN